MYPQVQKCKAELKQTKIELKDSLANYESIRRSYFDQRSEMGVEEDKIRSEIENARVCSHEDRELRRVRDARIEADEQVRNVQTCQQSLDNARERQEMAKRKKSKLHEREVKLAKEVSLYVCFTPFITLWSNIKTNLYACVLSH